LRPGCTGCVTTGKPVPLQALHVCSSIFGVTVNLSGHLSWRPNHHPAVSLAKQKKRPQHLGRAEAVRLCRTSTGWGGGAASQCLARPKLMPSLLIRPGQTAVPDQTTGTASVRGPFQSPLRRTALVSPLYALALMIPQGRQEAPIGSASAALVPLPTVRRFSLDPWRLARAVPPGNPERGKLADAWAAISESSKGQRRSRHAPLIGHSENLFCKTRRMAAKHLRAWGEKAMAIHKADVAELVDARDLKSLDGNVVWVRVPPPAPNFPIQRPFGKR
jgi:hypothetical protein